MSLRVETAKEKGIKRLLSICTVKKEKGKGGLHKYNKKKEIGIRPK